MMESREVLRENRMQITLAQAVQNYLTVIKLEGKSPATIRWHRRKLKALLEFLQEGAEWELTVQEFNLDAARSFIQMLMDRKTRYPNHPKREQKKGGLSPSTINGFARSLKAFSTWLHEDGYTETNILARMKAPKVPKILIEPLNEDELRKILLCIPQHTPEGARNFAVVLTFLDTGIRLGELVTLKLEDVDFGLGQFKVFGKGAEERSVPIGTTAKRAVIRYLEHYRPESVNPQSEVLFLNTAGRPLTRNGVSQMLRRIAKKVDIPRLRPHLLRHTFAVRYLINGGDVFTLQKILGHKSLEMTRRYVKLASVDVMDRHRMCSPVDNLGIGHRKLGRPKRRRSSKSDRSAY